MEIDAPVRPATQPGVPILPGSVAAPVLIAYCDEDGNIDVGAQLPAHHLELASGPVSELHERLLQHARRSEVNGRLRFIVPGMPEADHAFIAKVAARCWIDWCHDLEDGAVVWNKALRVDQ